MNHSWLALTIFILSYLLFILIPARRSWIAVGASLLLIATGAISPQQALTAINWNVMGIFVGTLVIVDILLDSRMPAYLAEHLVNRTKNSAAAFLALCGMTAGISMVVENVATVLIVAPIAMAMAKKLNINPKQLIIAIAVSSNLEGTATLIGDPPSMLLGGFAKMNFWDFFFYQGRPGIFFAVQVGALASFLVLYVVFRNHRQKVEIVREEKVKSWIPTWLLIFMIAALVASSLFDKEFSYMAGIICLVFGVAALFWDKYFNKDAFSKTIRALDWDTTFFLMGIFVLVGSITLNGWIDVTADYLSGVVGSNIFLGYVILIAGAVILSGFVDNVPFLAAMLPVTMSMADQLNIAPQPLLFGLLIGASLGGNITPIGASANIVACGLLKKEGYNVRWGDFVSIGLPYTIVATLAAATFVWIVWGPAAR